MEKRTKSVELLNKAVAGELTAILQYMYFHFRCDDRGYDPLAKVFKTTAIKEMLHAEMLAERILFLKGEVEMKPDAPTEKIHDIAGMLKKSRELEEMTVNNYNKWARECGEANDAVSKTLFEKLIADEEGHYDEFDTEIDNMDEFGENYLALQSMERAKKTGGGGGAE